VRLPEEKEGGGESRKQGAFSSLRASEPLREFRWSKTYASIYLYPLDDCQIRRRIAKELDRKKKPESMKGRSKSESRPVPIESFGYRKKMEDVGRFCGEGGDNLA